MIPRETLLAWVQEQPPGYEIRADPVYDYDPDTPNAIELVSQDSHGGVVDWLKVELG